MLAVSNSSPLIFLSKIGRVHHLVQLFEKVIIPREVYEEVVIKGSEKGYPDAQAVDELVRRKFIEVKGVEISHLEEAPIKEGEKAALSLALEEGIDEILIDEAKVRRMARLFGLRPHGTLWVLTRLYEEDLVSIEELKSSIFELIEKGYRIRQDMLMEILRGLE